MNSPNAPDNNPAHLNNEEPKISAGEQSEKIKDLSIDQLPERLGFAETAELSSVRADLVKAFADNLDINAIKEIVIRYQDLAEELVRVGDNAQEDKARLGLEIATALIKNDAAQICGDLTRQIQLLFDYKDRLIAALDLAHTFIHGQGMPLEDEYVVLGAEIDRIYAMVGSRTGSPGPRFQEFE